jgi:hypothetical protein
LKLLQAYFGNEYFGEYPKSVWLGSHTNCADYFIVSGFSKTLSQLYPIEVTGSVMVKNGTWYHVAFVYAGNAFYIYVNGSLSGSVTGVYASSTLNIVRSDNFFGKSYNSKHVANVHLDEIKIYNTALTQDQVQHDMNTVGIPSSGICKKDS